MDDRGRRISEMVTRMNGFKATTEGDFQANSVAAQKFSSLSDLSAKLDRHGSDWKRERNAAKAATKAKVALVENALQRMKAIWETAVSCEPQQPGISQLFSMPSSNSAESVIEAARASVAAATPLKPLFLSREMKEDFLENLTDTIQRYEDAVKDYNLHNGDAKTAKGLFQKVCKEVLAVRRELGPIIHNKYRDDPEKLLLWETASHLERPARRKALAEPGNVSQPSAGG